jgi:hypothetical protein
VPVASLYYKSANGRTWSDLYHWEALEAGDRIEELRIGDAILLEYVACAEGARRTP